MIYFDITELLVHAQISTKVTGIQRVVLEGVKGLANKCLPFFLNKHDREIHVVRGLRPEDLEDLRFFEYFYVQNDLKRGRTQTLRDYLAKCARDFVGIHSFFARLDALLIRIPLIGIHLARFIWWVRMGRISRWDHLSIEPIGPIQPGDAIAVYGCAWRLPAHYERLFAALPKGVKTQCFVHDLIPLVIPFADDKLYGLFEWWIPFVLEKSAQVVVSSESASKDLRDYAAKKGLRVPEIVKVALAHRMPIVRSGERPSLRVRMLATEVYALMVGTLEARKNHINMLTMWAKFFHSPEYANQKLILVGRWVWAVENVQKLLRDSGNVFGSVVVIDDATDHELAYLYEHCRFTVFPSHYEGWGLPIGESLSFAKPCLHFDISSMNEVGAGLSTSVPYPDYRKFYEEFNKLMLDDEALGRQVRTIQEGRSKLRTWRDFSSDVEAALK